MTNRFLAPRTIRVLCTVSVACGCLLVTSGAQAQETEAGPSEPQTEVPQAEAVAREAARTTAAGAERAPAIQWEEEWRHVGWEAAASTAVFAAGALLGRSMIEPPESSRFRNQNRLDLRGRRLALEGPGASIIDRVSDFTLYSLMLWPVADAAMLGIIDRNPGVAAQLMLMNAQAMSMTFFAVGLAKHAAGRLRPFQTDCNPLVEDCDATGASFFSGHTSTAFTGAGLVCVQHRHLDIYGGGAGDKAACGLALTAATATGVFRMMADRHWTSDVVVGAAVGLLSGWLMPRLLYFRKGQGEDFIERRMRRGVVSPFGSNQSLGLQYSRVF